MSEPSPANSDKPPVSDSVRVQILATEHWGLLATRSMLWNEVFTRASMFLTTLSAVVVALALVAQVSDFGSQFRSFALLVLPVVLFLGIATHMRLSAALEQEAWTVIGMNRLRHAYLDIAPDLEPYFITSQYDDFPSVLLSAGQYTRFRPSMAISSTPLIVAVLVSVLAGVIAALVAQTMSAEDTMGTTIGITVALVVAVVMIGVIPYREIRRMSTEYEPRFPREESPPEP